MRWYGSHGTNWFYHEPECANSCIMNRNVRTSANMVSVMYTGHTKTFRGESINNGNYAVVLYKAVQSRIVNDA